MKDIKNKIILVLTIILIMLIVEGLIADARYQTMLAGTGSASIANWSFKLVDANTQTTDVIDLAVTRTDSSDKVAAGKMAPGTYGEFEIGIDASGTETALEYTIDISLENAPRNLVFYSDSARTLPLTISNSNVTKTGYMTLDEVNTVRTEKIYWEWPYETGETDDEKLENNLEDTEDAGKNVTMEITVTGTQTLEDPSEIIEFTIDGTTYYADAGMTWEEWINSDYNIEQKFGFVTGGYIRSTSDISMYVAIPTGEFVKKTMVINSTNYIFERSSVTEPLTI